MGKESHRILITLLISFFITGQIKAQRFDFENDKKLNSTFNHDIAEALVANDVVRMEKILSKDPRLVNSSSTITTKTSYSRVHGGYIPLLYDGVNRCLEGKCTIEMVKLILKYKPFMNCVFNNLTPFYRILSYLANHETRESKNAEELFYLFATIPDYDINKRINDLAPPLSFLIGSNFNSETGEYNSNCISNEIIRLFINRGASVNSRDQYSTSLLIYSVRTARNEIYDLCIQQEADFTTLDKENHDVMYYAVKSQNIDVVKDLLERKYNLSPIKINQIGLSSSIIKSNKELLELITSESFKYVNDLQQATQFINTFPESKPMILKDWPLLERIFNNKTDSIPGFILIAQQDKPTFNKQIQGNILRLKNEYINSAKSLKEFYYKTKIFPLVNIDAYNANYYLSEKNTQLLQNQLRSLNSIIPSQLIEQFLAEVKETSHRYFENELRLRNDISQLEDLLSNYPSQSSQIEKKIQRQKQIIAKNNLVKKYVTVLSKEYWVAKGDKKWYNEIYEQSRDWISGGDNYNVFVLAQIENNSDEELNIAATVNLNLNRIDQISFILNSRIITLTEGYYLKIRPRSKAGILVMYKNVGGGVSFGNGLLSAGYSTEIYNKNPINISLNYIESIPSHLAEQQNQLIETVLANNGNVKTSKASDEVLKEKLSSFFNFNYHNYADLLVYFKKYNKLTGQIRISTNSGEILKEETISSDGSYEKRFTNLPVDKYYFVEVPDYGKFKVYVRYRLTHLIIKDKNESRVDYDY